MHIFTVLTERTNTSFIPRKMQEAGGTVTTGRHTITTQPTRKSRLTQIQTQVQKEERQWTEIVLWKVLKSIRQRLSAVMRYLSMLQRMQILKLERRGVPMMADANVAILDLHHLVENQEINVAPLIPTVLWGRVRDTEVRFHPDMVKVDTGLLEDKALPEGMDPVVKVVVDRERADKEGTDMTVIKQTLEGLEILSRPPRAQRGLRRPIIHLPDGMELDDQAMELATLLIAPPGGGKTVLLGKIIEQILPHVASKQANCFLLDVKGELWKRFGSFPSALKISPSSCSDPAACWNIFQELDAGSAPEIVARDITKGLLKSQHSDLQPFFENAANDFLVSTLQCMDAKRHETGDFYGNWHLSDFLKRVSVRRDAPLNWYDLAEQQPQFFGHIPNYLGDELGQGYGIVSELLVLLHSVFYGSMNTPDGQFSCIETVRSGGHLVFLCMDYANESEGSRKAFQTMLHLLLKHSTDADNNCLNYFFLDEGSVIGQVGTADALSLGRACGLRLFMGLQNADLLSLRMTEQERNALLSLFGNLILMNPQDQISRKLFADRFGEALCSWAFTGPMQKPMNHVGYRPVVADSDFALLQKKGDALCSFPRISNHPFHFHGYDPSIEG